MKDVKKQFQLGGFRAISPPPVPLLSFQFWRWLPNWHNHYGCPDCRKAFGVEGFLLRHLRREHQRWGPFVEAIRLKKRPRSIPLALLWRDPAFRARHAAAVRETLKSRWKDPAFRARHAAAVRETLKSRWKDPAFRARNAAAVRDRTARYWTQQRGKRTPGGKA